ncbi:MAG TPA: hypothetical protein VID24_03105 [Candidatus Eremiobacteraceae bacterium]|jgi:hypothetical protein
MVSYRVDGAIRRLTISGDVTACERQALFDAIRSDPNVPLRAALLVDARESGITFKNATIETRLGALLEGLGPKFSKVCAFIEPIHDPLYGKAFQGAGQKHGVHIGLFKDEADALRWLAPYTNRKTHRWQSR